MTPHSIPAETFDRLASGGDDALGVLRAGQRSKRLLLLHEVMAAAEVRAPDLFAAAGTAAAVDVLVAGQRGSADRVDEVLLHPHVGSWATRTLRLLRDPGDVDRADLGHFGALAAVAALRAGLPFDLTAAVRDGRLTLPGLGQVRVHTGDGWCHLRSRGAADLEIVSDGPSTTITLREEGRETAAWLPLRRLTSSAGGLDIDVQLDDLDPHRGCGHLPVAPRLGASVVVEWQAHFDAAWSLLVEDHRPAAEAIATDVAVIVPLRPTLARAELSATCHEALGAIGMTPPANPVSMALALVHELQHNKLSALLDLVPLVEPTAMPDSYSPWRSDPRPLRGLLQGAYAYLGLAGFWEVHRSRAPGPGEPARDLADFEFAATRDQVMDGARILQDSGRLTPAGDRFVAGMRRRLAELSRVPIPAGPATLALLARQDHATSWRLRNVLPNPAQVTEWADAWRRGRSCAWPDRDTAAIADGSGPLASTERIALIRHRLGFGTAPGPADDAPPPGDLLLLDGRFADAAEAYRRQIAADPDDRAAWAGLALARRYAPTPAARTLVDHIEQVAALHDEIRRDGHAPDPEHLGAWMAEGVVTTR